MKQPRIKAFLGDRAFYQAAMIIMIPVVLQHLTTAVFNFIDSAMLAHVDALSMSAVAVANKPLYIYNGLFSGFTGAAGLLLSQYHGAGKLEVCQRIFSVEMLLALGFSLAFALALFLFPEQIMRVFLKDSYTISIGVSYLRLSVWAYLPTAFSLVCLFSLRAMGVNFLPMLVGLLTIACNLLLEWILIFGRFGMPRMGVRGAALATLLARTIEMCIYAAVLLAHKTPFRLSVAPALRIGKPLMRRYLRKALPLTLNESLWSLGQVLYFWAYARINESALPAFNVADQISTLSFVLIQGLSGAVAVMVGRKLGANEFTLAKQNAKRLYGLGIMLSAASMGVALALSQAVTLIFPTMTPSQISLARHLVRMLLCFFPINTAYIVSFLLLLAGGDTKHASLLDSVYIWLLPAPASLAIALLLPGRIGLFQAVLIVQFLSCLKLIWALKIIKRGTWLNNLTGGHE